MKKIPLGLLFLSLSLFFLIHSSNMTPNTPPSPPCRALKALWNYLSQKGVNSDAIWEKIKDVVVKTIIS